MSNMQHFFKSFFLWELLKGMRLTGSYLFSRKFTIQYPEEKDTTVAPVQGPPCIAAIPER